MKEGGLQQEIHSFHSLNSEALFFPQLNLKGLNSLNSFFLLFHLVHGAGPTEATHLWAVENVVTSVALTAVASADQPHVYSILTQPFSHYYIRLWHVSPLNRSVLLVVRSCGGKCDGVWSFFTTRRAVSSALSRVWSAEDGAQTPFSLPFFSLPFSSRSVTVIMKQTGSGPGPALLWAH